MQADTLDTAAVLGHAPQPDALHLQRSRRGAEDAAQPLVEATARVHVARGELGERVALRHQPLFAGLQHALGFHLLGDIAEHGEDGRLAGKRDASRRDAGPERVATRPLQLEAQVLGPAVPVHLLRQHQPLRRVHVVVGRVLPDGVVVGDAEDVRGPLVDGEDDVVPEPADDGRKRARVEELEKQRVVLAWGGIRHE
jgi:hypothetical protein